MIRTTYLSVVGETLGRSRCCCERSSVSGAAGAPTVVDAGNRGRKGRSYGIHLVLASQTISGIEALFTKTESIFGQFPLRVALAGGGGILGVLNDAADSLPQGIAVVNTAGGVPDANRLVRFPDADTASVTVQRHRLWQARLAEAGSPAVFAGYAEHHLHDDPIYARLDPQARRRQVLVGRVIDVGLPAAGFTPGRHLAVLGTSPVGADVLHAAVLSLAKQHRPGTVRFVLVGLVQVADPACDAAAAALAAAGHPCHVISTSVELRLLLANSDLVEYVRTLVRGDTAAHDRVEAKLDAEGWEGLPQFMSALFFLAVDRRFKAGADTAEVIRFVADLRADLSDGGPELNTTAAETLIRSIIDPSIDYTIDQEMIGRIQAAAIHKILTGVEFSESELGPVSRIMVGHGRVRT